MTDEREKIIGAIEGWQKNRLTTFTPSDILHDFGDQIIAALRTPTDSEAHAEIQRLQDAKRRALALADERAKENVALRLKSQEYEVHWRAMLRERPDWHPRRAHIETVASQFKDLAALSNSASGEVREALDKANYKMGWWLSGALDDPQVCAEMKADINAWFEAHQPGVKITSTAPEPADTPDEGPDPLGYAKGERA